MGIWSRERPAAVALRQGEPAPPLALPALDGAVVRLDDLRGVPVLVSFLRQTEGR